MTDDRIKVETPSWVPPAFDRALGAIGEEIGSAAARIAPKIGLGALRLGAGPMAGFVPSLPKEPGHEELASDPVAEMIKRAEVPQNAQSTFDRMPPDMQRYLVEQDRRERAAYRDAILPGTIDEFRAAAPRYGIDPKWIGQDNVGGIATGEDFVIGRIRELKDRQIAVERALHGVATGTSMTDRDRASLALMLRMTARDYDQMGSEAAAGAADRLAAQLADGRTEPEALARSAALAFWMAGLGTPIGQGEVHLEHYVGSALFGPPPGTEGWQPEGIFRTTDPRRAENNVRDFLSTDGGRLIAPDVLNALVSELRPERRRMADAIDPIADLLTRAELGEWSDLPTWAMWNAEQMEAANAVERFREYYEARETGQWAMARRWWGNFYGFGEKDALGRVRKALEHRMDPLEGFPIEAVREARRWGIKRFSAPVAIGMGSAHSVLGGVYKMGRSALHLWQNQYDASGTDLDWWRHHENGMFALELFNEGVQDLLPLRPYFKQEPPRYQMGEMYRQMIEEAGRALEEGQDPNRIKDRLEQVRTKAFDEAELLREAGRFMQKHSGPLSSTAEIASLVGKGAVLGRAIPKVAPNLARSRAYRGATMLEGVVHRGGFGPVNAQTLYPPFIGFHTAGAGAGKGGLMLNPTRMPRLGGYGPMAGAELEKWLRERETPQPEPPNALRAPE